MDRTKFHLVREYTDSPDDAEALIEASQTGPALITRDGQPCGVILSDAEYQRLVDIEADSARG